MRIKFYIYLLFATLFTGLSFVSCNKDNEEVDNVETVIPANPFTLSLSGSSIDELTLDVAINSGVTISNYVVGLASTQELATIGSDSLSVASYVTKALIAKDVDFSEVDNSYVFSGAATVDLAAAWELEYSTEYVVAAFGVDKAGALTTGVNYTTLTTDDEPIVEPEILSDAFTLEVSSTSTTSAYVSVTPIEEVVNYYVVCQEATVVQADELAAGDVAIYYNSYIDNVVAAGTFDFSTPDDLNLYSGALAIQAQICYGDYLSPSTQYIFAVAAIDAEGSLLSDVAYIDFTTEQEEPTLIEDAFSFTTLSATTNEIVIDVAIDDAVEYYYISALSTKAFAVGYGSSADYYIGTVITAAQATSTDMEELVSSGLAYKESGIFYASALVSAGVSASTEYTFIVVGVAADGSYSTTVSTYTESTTDPLPENAFTLEAYDITTTSAMVSVAPTSVVENYYVICQPYSLVEQYSSGDYSEFLSIMLTNDKMMGMTDFAKTNGYSLFTGSQNIDPSICYGYELSQSTTYSFIVAGVDTNGNLTTGVSSINFTTSTEGVDPDADPFTLTIGTISANDVEVNVAPAANVPYYYVAALPATVLSNYYSNDPDYYVKDSFSYAWTSISAMVEAGTLYSGEQVISVSKACGGTPLTTGTDYVFMVLGVDAAGGTLTSMSLTVTPSEASEPAADLFTFTLSDITTTDITVAVEPDSSVVYYYAYASSTAWLEGSYNCTMDELVRAGAQQYLDMADTATLSQYGMIYSGEKSFKFSDFCSTLQAGSEYQFGAVAISPTGELLESMTLTASTPAEDEPTVDPFTFTLGDITTSDIAITVTPDTSVVYYYAYASSTAWLEGSYNCTMDELVRAGAQQYLDMADTATLSQYGMIYSGEKSFKFSDFCSTLQAGSEYQFGAVAISPTGELLESMTLTASTPAEDEPTVDPFTFTLGDITTSDIAITVTPDTSVVYYYAYASSTAWLEGSYNCTMDELVRAGAQQYLDMADTATLSQYGMIYSGEKSFKFSDFCSTLQAGSEYQFGAVAISPTGELLESMTLTASTPAE